MEHPLNNVGIFMDVYAEIGLDILRVEFNFILSHGWSVKGLLFFFFSLPQDVFSRFFLLEL